MQITGLDKVLFLGSLFAIFVWVFIKEPLLSIFVVIIIDASACYYTIKKAIEEPKSEKPILFYANIIKTILAIIALQQYNLVTVIYTVYQLISNSALIASIKMKHIMKR